MNLLGLILILFLDLHRQIVGQACLLALNDSSAPHCVIGVDYSLYKCLDSGIISVSQKLPPGNDNPFWCFAPYPFDFEMTGAQIMTDNLHSKVKVEGTSVNNFQYSMFISVTKLLAPRRFTFFKLDDKSVKSSFVLIRSGEVAFPNNNDDIVNVKSDRELLTLPCIASDPNANSTTLKLKKLVLEDESISENQRNSSQEMAIRTTKVKTITIVEDEYSFDGKYLAYDKAKGFIMNTTHFKNPHGDFSCVYTHANPKSEERFPIKISPPQDYVVEPPQKEVILFQNGKLHLSCRAKHATALLGTITVNGSLISLYIPSARASFSTHLKFQAEYIMENVTIGDFGNISCVFMNDTKRIIHTWSTKVLDMWNNPILNMTFTPKQVNCHSAVQNPKLSYILCSSESNCRHRLPCFLPESTCSNAKRGVNCDTNKKSCVEFSAEEPFSQGIIGCSAGNVSVWAYYIKGFDENIYTDWRKAPASALIEIVIPKQTLYHGGKFLFICRFSPFLSNGEVQWFYRNKNENATTLRLFKRAEKEKEFASSVRTKFSLSSSMTSIVCSVPQWDGKALWNVSERISVERTESPTVKNLGHGRKPIFVKGQSSRSLLCAAYGLPQPKIEWFRQGTNLSKEFEQIQTNDEDNTVELKFPSIKQEHAGVYVCNASNVAGFVPQTFSVTVRDEKKPSFANSTIHRILYIGDNEQLECKVESYPRPSISWTYPEALNKSTYTPIYAESDLKTVSSIRLNSISYKLQGEYNCTATNEFGTAWQVHIVDIKEKSSPILAIVIGASIAIVALLIPLVFVIWRLRIAKNEIRDLTKAEVDEFFQGNLDASKRQANMYSDNPMEAQAILFSSMPYKNEYEISREKLDIDKSDLLGEGAYGMVLRGNIKGMKDFVAVKTVKPNSEVSYFKALLSELKIMVYIGKNPNVVNLIGAYTENIKKRELYIVVELCQHGSLEKYLQSLSGGKKFRDEIINDDVVFATIDYYIENNFDDLMQKEMEEEMTSTSDLIRWSYQIANGMDYLASKKVIHSDLSTRNVLLHGDGTIRITDFGLSRQLYDYTQYVKKNQAPLPWRWMAIESLRNMTFSTQSDIWSFGVTMWEIFSLADIPYAGLSWTIDFVDELGRGLRMKKPRFATYQIYKIMYDCWKEHPEDRPTFSELKESILKVAFGEKLFEYSSLHG